MSCLGMGKISFRLQSSERWKLAEVQVPLENTVTRSSARQAKHKHRPFFWNFSGHVPQLELLVGHVCCFRCFDVTSRHHVVKLECRVGHLDFPYWRKRHSEPLVYFNFPLLIKGFWPLICKNVSS